MSRDLILITGVSGYIGFKTLILALEAGFKVRAVIRKAEQEKKLESHKRVAPFVNNLQFCVIPDLADTDSYDAHLQDVTGLLHIASPLANETDDYERDIVNPAIKVTLAVLSAAHRHSSIKRVVITSSAVTLVPISFMFGPAPPAPDLRLYTASDINTKFSTPYASAMEAYFAAKTLSRTATKEFVEREKPSFEYVNLLPALVFGPNELATNLKELMTSSCGAVMGSLIDLKIPEMIGASVHVDDVARAHIDALKPSVPGNRDYILSSDAPEGIIWDDAKEVVRQTFPEAVESGVLKLQGSMPTRPWRLETRDTEEAFGWKHISLVETVKALVGQYLELVAAEKK